MAFKQSCSRLLPWLAATSMGSLLFACASGPQLSQTNTSKAATANASEAQTMPSGMHHGTMDHGSMNHGMDLGPADSDFDLRFIDAMVPHHQGAIDMAKEVLAKSKRPEMKQLAEAIIAAQTKEIAQMQQWRQTWYPKAADTPMAWHSSMNHMMPMSAEQTQSMMMKMDLGAADEQFDLRFLDAMIPHHEGALVMAKEVLAKSKRPEMKQLAQDILASQQAEITQMQQWKSQWSKS